MAKYIMVVTSSAQEGRDDDYNAWYDNQHIHDICAVTGVISGQRWDAMPGKSPNPPIADYLAIYEIEADDPGSVVEEMLGKAAAGEMPMTDSIDMESANIWIYEKH